MLMGWVDVVKYGKTECRKSVSLEDDMKDHGAEKNSRKKLVDWFVC